MTQDVKLSTVQWIDALTGPGGSRELLSDDHLNNTSGEIEHLLPPRRLKLFGIDVVDQTLPAAVAWICQMARSCHRTNVAFLNAHCVNVSFEDPEYRQGLRHFDRIFADGSGVRTAARGMGVQLRDNVNGTDMFPILCAAAEWQKLGIFLLGGTDDVAAKAARNMTERYPALSICGTKHGYFQTQRDEDAAIELINKSEASILLVGLGVPLQENWITKNQCRLKVPVVIGVGGLFDYFSGHIERAPPAFRAAGQEWLWRLMMEPRRLAGRYISGNATYLTRLAWLLMKRPALFSADYWPYRGQRHSFE